MKQEDCSSKITWCFLHDNHCYPSAHLIGGGKALMTYLARSDRIEEIRSMNADLQDPSGCCAYGSCLALSA